ncbi:MAG: dodecin family protein [Planctomycetota bacterium]|nr:dodecin family protein [Planctomycetota bacterium]
MSVAKVIEISAASPSSFEDAIRRGIETASKTVKGIQGAWISEQKVQVTDDQVSEFRVTMRISFVVKDS